jgi:hypothetical protein
MRLDRPERPEPESPTHPIHPNGPTRPSGPTDPSPPPDPTGLAAARELGRALLWGGEAARALEALAPVHRARPWDREVQHLMLDALSALGRAAGDFAWTLEPEIVPLGPPILDELAVVLTANGGPATVLDLMLAVAERGYAAFTPRQLAAALEADRRFRVHRPGLAPECAVVARSPLSSRPSRACAGA